MPGPGWAAASSHGGFKLLSGVQVIDLVASISTDKCWLDAIDFSRLGRAEVGLPSGRCSS